MKKLLLCLSTLILCLSITGCQTMKVGFVGNSDSSHMYGSFHYFDGTESHKVDLDANDVLVLTKELEAEEGSLSVQVFSPDDELVELTEEEDGTYSFTASEAGDYLIAVQGSEAKGHYDLKWTVND